MYGVGYLKKLRGRAREGTAGALIAVAFAALFVIGYPGLSSASSEYTYGYGYAYEYQYQTAHLIVIKHVVNDNGGSATASQFTMTINGVTATGGNFFPGAEAPGTNKEVTPGSYNVTETGPSGYLASVSPDCHRSTAPGQAETFPSPHDEPPARHLVHKH